MIVVKLFGGLGNQMFQYAAGRRLAHMRAVELRLDPSGFEGSNRTYALDSLNIQGRLADATDLEQVRSMPRRIVGRCVAKVRRAIGIGGFAHIRESKLSFDRRILKLRDGVYLDGYWQSHKYFADVSQLIQEELICKDPQEGSNQELACRIAACNAVSVHVRRGDYVSDPRTNRYHGTCDLDYYARCVSDLTKTVSDPCFFVFSDDVQWVSDHLKLPHAMEIVSHNGSDQGHEDIRLMSQCRHHIIANSSFSWWGAWLNPHPGKIVYAPQRWLNDSRRDTQWRVPAQWRRM